MSYEESHQDSALASTFGPDGQRQPFNLSRWALRHGPLTRYLMIVMLVLGVAAYFQLGQDEDPPFTFRAMVVQAYWPGASAKDMAEQVTDKLERTLQEVPFSDKIRSYTKPGESLTILQLADNSPAHDVANSWYQARKKIGDVRSSLPPGVVGPFFNDDFGDVYGSIYALSADGFSDEELRVRAEDIRSQLLRVHDVAKVQLFGVQAQKVWVELSQKRAAEMGVDINQVIAQLNAQNAVQGSGVVDAGSQNVQVRVAGAFQSVDAIRALPIRVVNPTTGQAASIKLSDIAEVRRGYSDPPDVKVRANGKQVIAIGISMAKGGDIIALGKGLQAQVDLVRKQLPVGMELAQVQNQPQAVTRSVGEFVSTLILAIVIVLLVSFVSLGLHFNPIRIDIWPGLVVAITIPLVLAITFVTMFYWGVGLHKISLGSLIIALGLLVDDAIIAVEMMVRKLEEGYSRERAATFAYEVTSMPMLTGTLITAAGFLPIGLAKSMTGEYTFAIFAVTSAALVISWLVSVYFVPYLGAMLLHNRVKAHDPDGSISTQPHETFDSPFYEKFRRLLAWCLHRRYLTIGITFGTFALGLVGMGFVQQQFFPDSSRPEIMVDLWLPEGATMAQSEAAAKRFEARMMKETGVKSVTTWVGSGVPRFYLPLDQVFPQTNVSEAIVEPVDLKVRESLRKKLPALMATEFPELRTRVKLLPNGPPVPYPVQFRVVGPDADQVRKWGDEAKGVLRANEHMRGVNDNWNENVLAMKLAIDQDKARALGVTTQSIAQATQTQFSGSTIGQYREGDQLIDIVLRQPLAERNAVTDLSSAYVATSNGTVVPLTQIAKLSLGWEPGVLWREQRNYAVTVQGDVVEGLQGPTVTGELWGKNGRTGPLRALTNKMPPGYEIQVAGAVEEASKGQGAIVAGLPVALFIILTLLMLQLKSFSRAVLVFFTGPLGIAGAATALLVLNRPFGFVALLGVIALFGMIIRNSVILVDQIEQDRRQGVPAWNAIIESAVRRFRPIVLTAAAAVLAMIPLSYSEFWGPMAVAIMGGLILATGLTLLALPAMYATAFNVYPPKRKRHRLPHEKRRPRKPAQAAPMPPTGGARTDGPAKRDSPTIPS